MSKTIILRRLPPGIHFQKCRITATRKLAKNFAQHQQYDSENDYQGYKYP